MTDAEPFSEVTVRLGPFHRRARDSWWLRETTTRYGKEYDLGYFSSPHRPENGTRSISVQEAAFVAVVLPLLTTWNPT